MEVHEPAADLSGVEPDSVAAQSRLAHVVYMEIQVPAAHHGQNHTEGVLGLVGVGQVHLEGGGRSAAVWKKVNSFFLARQTAAPCSEGGLLSVSISSLA